MGTMSRAKKSGRLDHHMKVYGLVLDLRDALDAIRRKDPMAYKVLFATLDLAIEAAHTAQRFNDGAGAKELQTAARAVIDRNWRPRMTSMTFTEETVTSEDAPGFGPQAVTRDRVVMAHDPPRHLRPAEIHQLVAAHIHHVTSALRELYLQKDDKRPSNAKRRAKAASDAKQSASSVEMLFDLLGRYPEYFPRSGAPDADAVIAALAECAQRGRDALGPVLRACKVEEDAVKHAQKSLQRATKKTTK